MYGLKEQLLQEQNRLQSIIAKAREKDIAAPEGRLRISVDSGVAKKYQCIDDRCVSLLWGICRRYKNEVTAI